WVRLPEGHRERSYLISSGNHGHMGFFVGFWNNNVWGMASMNSFKGSIVPGEWSHVVWSYGYNRIRTWINGEIVQDDADAYPGSKGWGVGNFSIGYNSPVEVDDIQLFSFALSDDQVRAIVNGADVMRPDAEARLVPQSKKVFSMD
ncbi:MAG: LamG-like jellyroll fold domain-containing protein, partial [Kiritimatiellia bacterium]